MQRLCARHSLRIAVMCELLDVVHQALQTPLGVHLRLCSQGKPVELLVVSQVGEYRFNSGESQPVDSPAAHAVDRPLHALGVRQRGTLVLGEDRYLADLSTLGVAQALVS